MDIREQIKQIIYQFKKTNNLDVYSPLGLKERIKLLCIMANEMDKHIFKLRSQNES